MITFFFTVDVDQDGIAQQNERDALSWEAVAQVPRIAKIFRERGFHANWFIRADNQLSDRYGTAAYLHEQFRDLWSSLREEGDGFAWHPHLYERDANGHYVSDLDDEHCAAKLRRIHGELRDAGLSFDVVRVGEGRHGNALMRTLSDLGLRIDCSAIPGRARHDAQRSFDWLPTPMTPFHPSASDYRQPGADPLPIVEMPLTVVDIHADYDPRPLRRYLNLAYRPALLRDALERFFDGAAPGYIQTVLHPEEVCGMPDNGLYEFTLDAVARNVDELVRSAEKHGHSARAALLSDSIDELTGACAAEAAV